MSPEFYVLSKKPYYQKTELRFRCTGCGNCCYGDPQTYYIDASTKELDNIRQHLRLSLKWFLKRYTQVLPWGGRGIRLNANGACSFLVNSRCRIYHHRPAQCRTYPFWPEVVDSKRHWLAETKRCEGINQGPVIPLVKIERLLR